MANLSLQNGNKWNAGSVYDTAQNKTQTELNAVTAAVSALVTAGNNNKVLSVQNGALAAVAITDLIADGDEVSY